ncbi:MAG: hypothetical protein PHV63_03490 [Candidatus Daviesbacteria bacterium]|nr:hypothetical protein [Candidatus Daviesbacteria bacterium]
MHKRIQNILRSFLVLGAIYLLADAFIHFFDIKLVDVNNNWPASAIVYARLLDKISGAFMLLIAIIVFVIHKDLEKYRLVVYLSAIWTFFLGLTFIYLNMSTDYSRIFNFLPSLSFWMPFYREYLLLESGALIFYSAIVYLWFKTRSHE